MQFDSTICAVAVPVRGNSRLDLEQDQQKHMPSLKGRGFSRAEKNRKTMGL
jgi:hypothetical protein